MKTLKESILNRSSHGAKGFEVQRRIETIKEWLKEYDIENYIINRDFTIDVDEDAELFAMDLKEFPDYIQFGVVRGNFNCSSNNLKSLRGAPREVRKSFDCRWNKLTSLEGAPMKVKWYFDCSYNELTSLKGAPEKVGVSFYCSSNRLTSFEGGPKEVSGTFFCSNNGIKFTEEDVRKVCRVKEKICC